MRKWRIAAGIAGLLFMGLLWYSCHKGTKSADPTGRPVPVVAATVKRGDLTLTLTGLGTVTPLDTVTVRSRVDGQIVKMHFQEGQLVHEGELLIEIDPRPYQVQLMQAEGQKAKDEAALKNARMDLERFHSLANQGILAKQQLDAQTSSVIQYEAAVKSDDAQVESAKLNLTYSRITAPLSGRIGLRLVDQGNMVHANDANGLAVITPIQPITVLFSIAADNIQQVLAKMASPTKPAVDAYDRDLKTKLARGVLSAVDNQVDPGTGTVKLKALFDNKDLALFPNQFVNARLETDVLKDALIIPTAAVQRSPQGAYVYVVAPDNTVEMRPVVIRATQGDDTAVSKGLVAGETVVTDGLERLKPGSKVALPNPDPKKT